MYMQRNQKRGQVEDEYYAQKKNGVLQEAWTFFQFVIFGQMNNFAMICKIKS